VTGELGMIGSAALESALEMVVGEGRRVLVDLTKVTFFDSSAITALIRAHRDLASCEIEVRIVAPGKGIVRRMLDLTKLDEIMPIMDFHDAAVG
jgi:anti-sigma B factor antagonist